MTEPLLLRGDARALPLADESVDLVVTSPPYFGLRDYGTDAQIGAEPTPGEFIDALLACTREMVRVLKHTGSIFVNLGDKYSGTAKRQGMPPKSLMMLPERYRIAAVDELGLIARAVIVWTKPNGLPESVTDRVRRSHEDWVHLTKSPRYFQAVDEIREEHVKAEYGRGSSGRAFDEKRNGDRSGVVAAHRDGNPLGKLPGSVWSIATQPLKVPAELNVDHYAAFPMEWPRRLITGWCPLEVCTVCGEGRRPVAAKGEHVMAGHGGNYAATPYRGNATRAQAGHHGDGSSSLRTAAPHTITGYACGCPDTSAPATPGVVLDPFGGTGTTALVAHMLGRRGISVDLSADYQRIARWRCSDPKERARAAGITSEQVAKVPAGRPDQDGLFGLPEVAS